VRAWAATSSWRGDLKLFARIAQKAVEEVAALGEPHPCSIEFEVRDDLERYDSIEGMLELVPAGTLRSFAASCIRVGGAGLLVEVRFRRKRSPGEPRFSESFGVSVEVSSDGPHGREPLEGVRDALIRVIARGGLRWGKAPLTGLGDGSHEVSGALYQRWHERKALAQFTFLGIAWGVLALVLAAAGAVHPGGEDPGDPGGFLGDPYFLVVATTATQLISYPLSNLIFPAIEIADTAPWRRILQVIGRSGILSAAIGVVVKVLFSV
jgi:hypothetical protein